MSLRYTGEATMDEPALRDVERWKDKIEVRLDNRQVFFLFFGSAMVACMLFVLGVIVGKRLESRGRAEAPAMEDPLAVLDRFGAATAAVPAAPAALTFPQALIGNNSGKNRPPAVERLERPTAERATIERVNAKATLTAAAPVALGVPAAAPKAVPAPAAAATLLPKISALPRLAPMPAPSVAPPPAAPPVSKKLAALPRPTPPAQANLASAAGKEQVPTAKMAGGAEKVKGRFLLQLSSFQERAEADAFARRFTGQNAYVVATEIPGKGTWYRVRVGSYGTMAEAAQAKTSFERDHNVIAYVAGTGPAK